MRKFIFFSLLVIFSFSFFINQTQGKENKYLLFYGQGCPHCAKVEKFLDKKGFFQKYHIQKYEIYFNKNNALLYNQLLDKHHIPVNQRGVPTLITPTKVIIGDQPIINFFLSLSNQTTPTTVQKRDNLPTRKGPLTLLTVIGGALVDAINPCAFAVLVLLLATTLINSDSKKALKNGLSFSLAIFLSYFAMGLGIYHLFITLNISTYINFVIGFLALILGLLNLKDWLWYGKGVLMEVPLSWRPRLKKIINQVNSPISAFGIGILVSSFLLPCTSGPYLVILGLLAINKFKTLTLLYLLTYNLIFISPMIIITLLVSFGLKPEKLEALRQKNIRYLHLLAGILLLTLAFFILKTQLS